LATKIIKE